MEFLSVLTMRSNKKCKLSTFYCNNEYFMSVKLAILKCMSDLVTDCVSTYTQSSLIPEIKEIDGRIIKLISFLHNKNQIDHFRTAS